MPDAAFLLDTNVFNHVFDGTIDLASLRGKRLFATHVQRDELANTKDPVRREALLETFAQLLAEQVPTSSMIPGISVPGGALPGGGGVVPTESAVWGVSRWGAAKWGNSDDVFAAMHQELNALNKRKGNNAHDILIAETALRNGLVLITADSDLFAVVTKFGGACANAFLLKAV
jgi:predicted nucleic acid-binding protein